MFPVSEICGKELNQYFEYLLFPLGADLANMVNAAAIYAASEGDTSVTTRHLEFAKDKILMGKCFVKHCLSFGWSCNLLCVYHTVE